MVSKWNTVIVLYSFLHRDPCSVDSFAPDVSVCSKPNQHKGECVAMQNCVCARAPTWTEHTSSLLYTNELTPWSSVIVENLTAAEEIFPLSYVTRRFVFELKISRARWIQSLPFLFTVSFSLPSTSGSSKLFLTFRGCLSTKTLYAFVPSPSPHSFYVSHPPCRLSWRLCSVDILLQFVASGCKIVPVLWLTPEAQSVLLI